MTVLYKIVQEQHIDEQHREIVDKVAVFANTLKQNNPKLSKPVFDEIVLLMDKHFDYEDRLMRRYLTTPETAEHMDDHTKLHKKIMIKLFDVYHYYCDEPDEFILEADSILAFVLDWVYVHIDTYDREMIRLVTEQKQNK